MEHNDELIILSESKEAYIGICHCCSVINFVYKNIALKFKEEEFSFFYRYMNNLSCDDFIFESKTGKNIFMATPSHNMVFCFSRSEIQELKILMNEASIMLEVNKIIN